MLSFSYQKTVVLNFLLCILAVGIFSCKNAPADTTDRVSDAKNVTGQEAKVSQIVSIEQVAGLVKDEQYRLIDLRTHEEIQESGTIEFSSVMDFRGEHFEQHVDLLDKEGKYILYCKGGGRSAKALKMFNRKGFKHVKEMHAGYDKWAAKYRG